MQSANCLKFILTAQVKTVLVGTILLVVVQGRPARADWRQFRGPNGQGHSSVRDLPVQFSDTQNVSWKTPIAGRGWSSPVILDGQVWMTTAVDEGKSLRAIAVDSKSGTILHNVEVFSREKAIPKNTKNSFASPTPVIEPGRVYVHFGRMGTACLSTRTGKVLWRNNELVIEHKEGPGSSPILFEDLLIVNCDGMDEQFVAALHKQNGHIAWKTDRSAPQRDIPDFCKAFSTPIVIGVGRRRQLISTGADQMQSYNPSTGKENWKVRYHGFSNVPIPLAADGKVFVVTDFARPQLWAIRSRGGGDVTGTHVVWRYKRQVPSSASPILVDGRIFMVGNTGVLTCLNAKSGHSLRQKRLGGNYSASPIYADRRLYFSSEAGKVIVVEPDDSLRILAENQLSGRLMASPAAGDGGLFVRTETHLYRFEK